MNALFAPFRNRDLNPLHYDNKLKFWKELIVAYAREKQIIQLDVRTCESWFLRKGIKPKCIELAIGELAKEKHIQTREDALKPVSHGFIHSVFNKLVWQPLSWSTSYFFKSTITSTSSTLSSSSSPNQTLNSPKSPTQNLDSSHYSIISSPTSNSSTSGETKVVQYVLTEVLEAKAEAIMKALRNRVVYTNVDTVVDLNEIVEIFCGDDSNGLKKMSENDLDLLMRYLEARKMVYVANNVLANKRLVKFSLSSHRNVEMSISEIELAYLKVSRPKIAEILKVLIKNKNLKHKKYLLFYLKNKFLGGC